MVSRERYKSSTTIKRVTVRKNKFSIVADENIPYLQQMFAEYGDITTVNGRTLEAAQLQGVDILLVRSVTKVTEQLLAQSSIRFVGSATIGTDHIDLAFLKRAGVVFSNAPGCNADAVVEYDLCCISHLLAQSNEDLIDKTIAIIGVGNVGQRLADRLAAIGVKKVLLNDPPRAQQESGFDSLDYVLEHADIIAVHTPLIKTGPFSSHHLLKIAELSRLKQNAILLNAGRGATIKEADLLTFLSQRTDVRVVLDVWEHEPQVDPQLAKRVAIATPHIAGYSLEGRVRGTFMLKAALSRFLEEPLDCQLNDFLPVPEIANVHLNPAFTPLSMMSLVYDPYRDDRALRVTLDRPNQAAAFDLLRKNYRSRREFSTLALTSEQPDNLRHMFNLGFSQG